jgi:endonuclease/exonuclease/phosphatase family metal-dependent hydrolase
MFMFPVQRLFFCLFIFMLPFFSSAQTEVKVMSYNIRLDLKSDGENQWDKRKDVVTAQMNFYGADFIGAQEVLHNQLEYLQKNLDGYNYIGVGRDDGKTAGEYSCIFYKKDKYDVIEQSTFWLSPTPGLPSKGWDAALNRVCTYGLFRDKKTKQLFWVFNTHFDHVGKTARLESAKLIHEKIMSLNKKNYPVIVAGDFNSKPDEPPAQFMMSVMNNSRDLSRLVFGPVDTWNAFRFSEVPRNCIDYIFTSKDNRVRVEKFATLTDSYEMKYPSDHFPIIAHMILNKK